MQKSSLNLKIRNKKKGLTPLSLYNIINNYDTTWSSIVAATAVVMFSSRANIVAGLPELLRRSCALPEALSNPEEIFLHLTNPDKEVSFSKRMKLFMYKLLPLKPVL